MNNLLNTIKKFQLLKPDSAYTKRSRETILAPRLRWFNVFGDWVLQKVQTGAAVALAGFCLFIIFAGARIWQPFSPLNATNLDLSNLKAEAQAIDIQINLANLRYSEPPQQLNPLVNPPAAAEPIRAMTATTSTEGITAATIEVPTSSPAQEPSYPVSSTTIPLTIDEALEMISE